MSSLVWSEALYQAQDMALSWIRKGSEGTTKIMEDTATLALHVLTKAGFGMSYPFDHAKQKPSGGHAMTYRDSLSLCLKNLITFTIFPKDFLRARWLPSKLRTLGQAAQEFQRYIEETLAHERKSLSDGTSGTGNLISAMLRASSESQSPQGKDEGLSIGLADNEVFGNIFVYSLAGHETTANTLATALVLLAANPNYQQWLAEELDSVRAILSEPQNWPYDAAFPRLQFPNLLLVFGKIGK